MLQVNAYALKKVLNKAKNAARQHDDLLNRMQYEALIEIQKKEPTGNVMVS